MFRRLPLLLVLPLLAAGCSSISVLPTSSRPEARAPRVLYAAPFSFAGAEVNVDRKGKELADFEAKLSAGMAKDIALRASGVGLEGKEGNPPDAAPRAAWLVKGRFVRVNQGSRALRAVVGLGAGGTKMEAQIEVFDLSVPGNSARPFLTFLTTGGSGAFPGGIFNPTVVTIVFWSATGLPQGVTDDATRTCRMVIATLSQEMGKRGYLAPGQQKSPKTLGGGEEAGQKLKAQGTAPAGSSTGL